MDDISLKYNNLEDRNRKAAKLFISNRMDNEGVPFKQEEDIDYLLTSWNPTIVLKDGLMKCFSESDGKTIDRIVQDRVANLNKSI